MTTTQTGDLMPALTNRTIADARRQLRDKYPDLVIAVHGDETAPVRSQIPLAGQPILGRRQVALSDLEWQEEAEVPDLVAIDPPTVAHVYAVCGVRGLDVVLVDGEGVRRPREGDWSRCVTGYDDAPPTLPRGAAVRVLVGDTVISTMPNVVGRPIASAARVLKDRYPGLRLEIKGSEKDLVKAQYPPAYHELRAATASLTISAEALQVVPDLRGMIVSDAEVLCVGSGGLSLAICESKTQAVDTCVLPPPDSDKNSVISDHNENTPPGSPIPAGGTVGVIIVPPVTPLNWASLALGAIFGFAAGVVVGYLV